MSLIDSVKGTFSKKEEKPKCHWCSKKTEHLPASKKVKSEGKWKELRFCSEECKRNFRIAYNKKKESMGCSRCLLSKIH